MGFTPFTLAIWLIMPVDVIPGAVLIGIGDADNAGTVTILTPRLIAIAGGIWFAANREDFCASPAMWAFIRPILPCAIAVIGRRTWLVYFAGAICDGDVAGHDIFPLAVGAVDLRFAFHAWAKVNLPCVSPRMAAIRANGRIAVFGVNNQFRFIWHI